MRNCIFTTTFILCSLITNAQDLVINTFYNSVGTWDSYDKDWVFEDGNNTNIIFTIKDNVMRADDNANSVYNITSTIDQEDYFLSYNAVDNKGRKCVIMISDNDGIDKMAIMYVEMDLLLEYWFYF